jgi:hypothetical protein
VRRHQQGGAGVCQIEQFLPEIAARFRVHRAGRFVQEQQLRRVHDRAGQGEALFLSAAERAGELFRAIGEGVGVDQLVHPRPPPRPRQALHGGHELQVLAHGEIFVQRKLLGHVTDPPAQRLRLAWDRQPQHLDLAGAGREQTAKHADRGRFAGTVGTEKAVDVRMRHAQIDAVDRLQRAEPLAEAAGDDRAALVHAGVHPGLHRDAAAISRRVGGNSTRTGKPAGNSAPAAALSALLSNTISAR